MSFEKGTTMIRRLFIPVLIVAGAVQASAQAPEPGARLGVTPAEVSTALQADGYELTEVFQRQSLLRVRAMRGGERHEFRVTLRDGNVLSHKVLSKAGGNVDGSPILKSELAPTASSIGAVEPALAIQAAPEVAAAGIGSIADMLAAQGYQLLRAEQEGGRVEAYAVRDNQMWELKIDAESGRILSAELED